jgi:hypothetical protein
LIYSFFPEIDGVLIRESHVMKILFHDVLGVVSPKYFIFKMVGEKDVYLFLGLFGVFKKVVSNVERKWRPNGFLQSIQHPSDPVYDGLICYFLENNLVRDEPRK